MKKQIVLLFLMFFTLLFSMPNNTCKAYEIENTIDPDSVSYSAGLNVLDVNDFETTDKTLVTKHAMFIAGSYQDKVTIRFRGREMAHMKDAEPLLQDFAKELSDVSQIEKPSKIEGRNMSIVLAPKK